MANPEQQLLSRIIRSGELSKVVEWGITNDDFRTSEAKGTFISLKGYFASLETSGSVPGVNATRYMYPGVELCDDSSMTTEALCTEVRKNRLTVEAGEHIKTATDLLSIDPMLAIQGLGQGMQSLQSLGLKNVDQQITAGADEVLARYELAEKGLGLSGLTWPWAIMNDASAGIQDDDYIVLYGRPKSKKSFVLTCMAAWIYEFNNKNVMVYTKEMPAWQLFRRILAFIAKLQYDDLRLGRLSPQDKNQLLMAREYIKEEAEVTKGRHMLTVVSGRDAPSGTDSMGWLRGKVDKYKPDVVFIDGLYLMSSDKKVRADHERVREISRAGRQMVLDTGIPLIATMQANRKAAGHQNAEFDEIAYSDAIGQDATCAIRVIGEQRTPTIAMVLAGSREFQLDGFRIWGQPCCNFSFKEVMTAKDIEKAKEADTKADDNPKVPKPIRKKNQSDKKTEDALVKQLSRV